VAGKLELPLQLASGARKFEIRRHISNLQRHIDLRRSVWVQ
jgi:hypothetical protein